MKKLITLLALALCLNGKAQVINTVVGGGVGDGGPATNAYFNMLENIFVDTWGNIFIADAGNHRIRKINTNGIISTIAGNGNYGFAGDGGLATSAELDNPQDVFVDALGNLFIADEGNRRIRKVDTNGIITTIAGNGNYGYAGNGGPATAAELTSPGCVMLSTEGNLYIGDQAMVRMVNSNGIISTILGTGTVGENGDGGPATAAQVNRPTGFAIDNAHNLYVLDSPSDNIRKINTSGIISTFTSLSMTPPLTFPSQMVFDGYHYLYIASAGNNFVFKLSITDSTNATTIAGTGLQGHNVGNGGQAINAQLYEPAGVGLDASGNVYISDFGNESILKVDINGIITTIAGPASGVYTGADGDLATAVQLNAPKSVAHDKMGNIYFTDFSENRIRKVNSNGIVSTYAGIDSAGYAGDGAVVSTSTRFNNIHSLATDAAGNLYIADYNNARIRMVNTNGIINTIAGNGITSEVGDGGPATAAELYNPTGVALDALGNIYITTEGNVCLRKVSTSGIITAVVSGGEGFGGDGGPAINAKLNKATMGVFDALGNLYISDYGNHRIRKIATNGTISTFAGNGTAGFLGDGGAATAAELNYPNSLEIDSQSNLYIADLGNERIRKINSGGIITTVAGNGTYGYLGDGGQATAAELNAPYSITLDTVGNLYIADYSNNRIRIVYNCNSSMYYPSVTYTLTADPTPHIWDAVPAYSSNTTSARWYWGDGTSTSGLYPSHTYSVAGMYNICVTAYSLCGDSVQSCQNDTIYRASTNSPYSTMIQINVVDSISTQISGISTLENNNKLIIYPNPNNGSFVIEPNNATKQTMQVYDVNGKLVLSQTIIGKTTIDASSLNEGVYNISLQSTEGIINKKLVIVR